MNNGWFLVLTSLITASSSLIAIWLKEHLTKKAKPDLSDPDFEDLIRPILDNIQEHIDAHRVAFFEGRNGTNTLSGYHIKTITMVSESNRGDVSDIKSELKDISIETFARNIKALRKTSEKYIVSFENDFRDDLAHLNLQYGKKTIYAFKVHTSFDKWTGILVVSFDQEYKTLNESQVSWLKAQSSRIGSILKKN